VRKAMDQPSKPEIDGHSRTARFDAWFVGKSFNFDWTSMHFPTWDKFISPSETRAILEIGSAEGRFAVFFLEYCPDSRITCIDAFIGSDPIGLERRFDANLATYGSRVEKIKSRSIHALERLGLEGRLFDLVYIDGSHRRDDVIIDSLLAWRLLNANGLIIWDDYLWDTHRPTIERPQEAIDFFLQLYADELEVVHLEYQAIARRRAIATPRSSQSQAPD
jgi:predicted O-methyltransferase YrrM